MFREKNIGRTGRLGKNRKQDCSRKQSRRKKNVRRARKRSGNNKSSSRPNRIEPINRNTLENFAVTKDPKTGEFVDNLYGSQGLITLLTKQLKEVIDSSPDAITNSGKENFLNQISTPLNRLISLEVDINDVLLGYSMYVGGKTVNSVAQTSSVSDIVKRISQDPTFVEQLLNTNYAKDNYFLKFLKNEEFLKMLKNLPMP